ncbi:putative teichoic acid glycosylation protein [Tetragenococcus halophilus subsp. halophilus]|uniref:Teichoic acid glycosylation protein n=2 Tax=Tetragenococcus halophilus TaxID=51669 RepID=A0AAN1SH54_TETHN|nr:GtrA family protein [Tetragenococcus halophilus]AOF49002.1 teichoic acid glycosylation protein [Tetragenococcus halophilus]BAK94930.1 putative teichoic acid glycosylation protein [Tetragenococcus halophilus NBRC 12172]GBD60510.1 putative teichoic acid glycosylation protein [Tetragenococcus halophilus subsp. halophilus]GBD66994.1 putative teichoic acid glycosylation protein [Tetragenococcus halophilus subsp. halophilus]GBD71660.1 putative teichoic acid glycosylation protein [Tetragenococcus 
MKQLIKRLKEDQKLQEIIAYLFFGGMTTVVNFITFFLARRLFGWNLVISNTLSWIFSVLFAFATNKRWVFKSQTTSMRQFFSELSKFFFYRIVSFGIDMGCMLLFVDSLNMKEFWAKLITQIIIVVANYVFSKFFIFTQKNT